MLPVLLPIQETNYSPFIEEFRRGERHLVCMAHYALTLLDVFLSTDLVPGEEISELVRKTNQKGITNTFYQEHGVAMSILPLARYSWEDDTNITQYRDDYDNRKAISKCIKEVFRLNKELICASKISFLFELSNFNNALGIELVYHHATSEATTKDKILKEVSYLDTSTFNP